MSKFFIVVVGIVMALYLAVCAALYLFQSSLIYFPQLRSLQAAGSTLQFDNGGERIVVTARKQVGAKALIYFGGNAEEVSQNLLVFAREFPNHSIYLMHYRGYGGSSGNPSEVGLVADSLVLFDSVFKDHSEVSVIGRSLGSGVAVQLASARPVANLVLVTPYASVVGVASAMFPYFPVKWLIKDRFESENYVNSIKAKSLILASESDSVIPEWSTKKLHAAFGKDKVLYKVISDSDHNSISGKPQYLEVLKSFLIGRN
jgi:uncharacterized protein